MLKAKDRVCLKYTWIGKLITIFLEKKFNGIKIIFRNNRTIINDVKFYE